MLIMADAKSKKIKSGREVAFGHMEDVVDTLKSIRVFSKIVEFGSLSSAAADMNISPAMASKHLKHLEKFVEARLIHRTTRSLRLTEEGKLYYEHCQIALNKIDEIRLVLGAGKGIPTGTLRVALPRIVEVTHIQSVISEYVRRYPQMNLDIAFSDNVTNLVEDGFDLVLHVAESLPASSMIARRLAPIEWGVCASPAYLARHGQPTKPEDLTRHLTLTCAGRGEAWSFEGEDGRVEVKLDHNLFLDSRLACQFALEGMGIAILPLQVLDNHVRHGRLELLLADCPMPKRHLYAIYPSRRYLTGRVRTFIDLLAEATRRLPDHPRTEAALCEGPQAVVRIGGVPSSFPDTKMPAVHGWRDVEARFS